LTPAGEPGAGALRVLFLTQTFPRSEHDGAGPFVRDLARALVAGGDRVRVLVPGAAGVAPEWLDRGVEVRSFRYAPRPLEVLGYGRSLARDERLRPAAALAAPLYFAGLGRAVRRELVAERWDLVQAHWIVPNGLVAARFARRLPVAVGLHGSDVFLAERRLARPLVARALARVSALTSCSPELARRIEALGFDPARTRVVPYGVDVGLFRPDPERRPLWRARLGVPQGAPLVLGVGRMVTKKGFHLLLAELSRLFARVPDGHLVLAGGGDLLDSFRAASAAWRERVHLPGPVLHDQLPDLYRAADLFVLPAVHDAAGNVDGLPNVVLEAMASGLPVVASAISGIPLAVGDGTTGRLVPEGDAGALVAALAELALTPERARALGEAGRRRAERELTWSAVAARYREAYELALARPVSRS
jgi:glycosyltransferase involved in cell wall biosynthesis